VSFDVKGTHLLSAYTTGRPEIVEWDLDVSREQRRWSINCPPTRSQICPTNEPGSNRPPVTPLMLPDQYSGYLNVEVVAYSRDDVPWAVVSDDRHVSRIIASLDPSAGDSLIALPKVDRVADWSEASQRLLFVGFDTKACLHQITDASCTNQIDT